MVFQKGEAHSRQGNEVSKDVVLELSEDPLQAAAVSCVQMKSEVCLGSRSAGRLDPDWDSLECQAK